MLSELDQGIRCEKHVGEVFPPRCVDCDVETVKASDARTQELLAERHPHALLECRLHPGYFHYPATACDRCSREGTS